MYLMEYSTGASRVIFVWEKVVYRRNDHRSGTIIAHSIFMDNIGANYIHFLIDFKFLLLNTIL